MSRKLYTTAEVVELAGVSRRTIQFWVKAGLVAPAVTGSTGRGNTHRFSRDQVERIRRKMELYRRYEQAPL